MMMFLLLFLLLVYCPLGCLPIPSLISSPLSPSYLLSRPPPLLYPNPPIPHPLRHVRASLVWSVWTALLFSIGRQVRPGEPRHGGSPLKSPPPCGPKIRVCKQAGNTWRIHSQFLFTVCTIRLSHPMPPPHTVPPTHHTPLF
jgi:hypothetical protein